MGVTQLPYSVSQLDINTGCWVTPLNMLGKKDRWWAGRATRPMKIAVLKLGLKEVLSRNLGDDSSRGQRRARGRL